jgi:hypothetical protein
MFRQREAKQKRLFCLDHIQPSSPRRLKAEKDRQAKYGFGGPSHTR